jgi:hypothetical protein
LQLDDPVLLASHPRHRRERHPKQRAISAPVIRSLRRAVIASTRSSGVRRGIERGAEGRSNSPASPSAI